MSDAAQRSVAIGFFDGVHLGHQAILRGATRAITFRNHPLEVLRPAAAPKLIMSLEERLRTIGVPCEVLDFTPELAKESAEEFARHLAGLGRIRCGADWRFGRSGAGDVAWLRTHGFEVEVVPFAVYKGERISSTRIRQALEAGKIEEANAMLGRRYGATGRVVAGKGYGRRIGFPTVNLALRLPLKRGVYAVEVAGLKGIANYGVAPTLGEAAWAEPVLEVHFTKFAGEEIGETPRVEFCRFIREERRFGSVDELRRQIERDCEVAGR